MTTVVATPGQGPDRPQEVSYTDIKVIGNGSFGVVYQARLTDSQEMVAIKKVLQDKRFKVRSNGRPAVRGRVITAQIKKLQIGTFQSTKELKAPGSSSHPATAEGILVSFNSSVK